jgi:subtilisin-like proprotein convertase family protein
MKSPSLGRPLCRITTLLIAALVIAMLPYGRASARPGAIPRPPHSVCRHFAEIEVVLSDSLTLKDLASLPHAPGSGVELLGPGARARAQLPAVLVGDLIEQGQAITVLRDFMLSEKSEERGKRARAGFATATADCSGDPVTGSNDADHPIPELQWVHSDIAIENVPFDMMVTCVDVHFEIVHPLAADLWVDLKDQGQTHQATLWFLEGGDDDRIARTVTGVTEFAGEQVNQAWGLWATDVVPEYEGYIDSWWIKIYYEQRDAVPAHDERSEAAPIEAGVPYRGTTVGATGQYESRCGYQDALDVWHVYTPTQTGLVAVVVESDDQDTTLAVFDPCGVEQACCDDSCDGANSAITMPMTVGVPYLIRVAGYDYETGDYTLVVEQQSPELPAEPGLPNPADGGDIGALPIVLSWNEDAGGNALDMYPVTTRSGRSNVIEPKGIYGQDDRAEEYEVTDPDILAAGAATAMFLHREELIDKGDGTYELPHESLAWWYTWLDPIGTGNALCADEPFHDQPSVGTCTGVLVGPDLIATAGHCVACLESADLAVVFDFVMQDADTATVTLNRDQVYWVAEILEYQAGSPDWGLVRLDREVTSRTPLALRRTGQVADGQPVFMVGHPWGMPRKYAAGALVRENTESTFFQANVDAYRGNSGSPVINLQSMVVEGLLVRGMPTFAEDILSGCDRSSACPDAGCLEGDVAQWEDVTRATTFSAAVPSFEVYLGVDPDQLDLVATGLAVPRYAPVSLRKDAVYYWRVVARNVYGQVAGPLWSFRTALSPAVGQ